MSELRNGGVEDVLLAVVDGVKGFPEVIMAAFPKATVQTSIVHLLRHRLVFVSFKDRDLVAGALTDIYRAVRAVAADAALRALLGAVRAEICRHRPELAPRPGSGGAVLRLPYRRPALLYTKEPIEALNAKLGRFVRI